MLLVGKALNNRESLALARKDAFSALKLLVGQ